MSVLTPKRVFPVVAAVLLATAALASNPAPRMHARMAFDQNAKVGVLFGGRGAFDGATQLVHNSDETWLWVGRKWVQVFPTEHPDPRSSHGMVYDSARERVVLFGGRREALEVKGDPTLFADTWIWKDDRWTKLDTGTAPPARSNFGIAYDSVNDRIVLFGGIRLDAELLPEDLHDTWEFDGTNWQQVGAQSAPDVLRPVLAYDAERQRVIMMGLDKDDFKPVMYGYDSAAKTWAPITPEKMPPCVSEGHMVYQTHNKTLFWMGGICGSLPGGLDEAYEWDGTNWTKITTSNTLTRSFGQAVTFDTEIESVVIFGGAFVGSLSVASDTRLYKNGLWRFLVFKARPDPRSLATFQTDTASSTIWLFGGLFESGLSSGFLADLWGYRGGQWFPIAVSEGPSAGCSHPNAVFDTDRNRLVLVCSGATVYELDPATLTWKTFTPSKNPDSRRFASVVYDRRLKKTVLFGGYGISSYFNDTWLWDGTNWTEVKGDKPNNRGLAALWFDPHQQKTLLYGGIGRPNLNSKVTRYSDMWAFDGTDWTKMNVSQTPGERLGAQIAINPNTGKLLLMGGLRAESAEDGKVIRQFFSNDTWEWDGGANAWTALQPERAPDTRENGMMAWDPISNEIVVFGGYSFGFYRSDVWAWNGITWRPLLDQSVRRRPSGRLPASGPPPTDD